MASLTIKLDASAFLEFMDDWREASARLNDVPEYLWNRMQGLLLPGHASRLRFVNGTVVCEPSPEALSILATLRALR